MTDETLYRIHGRAIRTGKTWHGSGAYPKDSAQEYANQMNRGNRGWSTHWIEPVPTTEEEPQP